MAYCLKCGYPVADDAKYCAKCGATLNPDTTESKSEEKKNLRIILLTVQKNLYQL